MVALFLVPRCGIRGIRAGSMLTFWQDIFGDEPESLLWEPGMSFGRELEAVKLMKCGADPSPKRDGKLSLGSVRICADDGLDQGILQILARHCGTISRIPDYIHHACPGPHDT